MPGDETHGYDLVVEFAEQAYRDILSAIFDSGGWLLDQILGPLGIDAGNGAFRVDVLFDRPTDAGVPAAARDVIDVRVDVGDVLGSPLADLRFVVGVDVDRTGPTDLVYLNFEDRLYFARARALGFPVPGLDTLLRNQIRLLPILPTPVVRTTTNNITLKEADVLIIDDTSGDDRDASAFTMTFGGGVPGDRNAFVRSFISPGGNGGVAAAFPWLCRVISPLIDQSLQLGGAFTNCRLTRSVTIDEKEDIDLTKLALSLEEGFIAVSATVRKTGFCYEASGTVGARIRIAAHGGTLFVTSEVDDPDVDVDVPWYCYLAGAVIGGLVGILFGVITAIVGALLVPLIIWIATETIEGVVEDAINRVRDALDALELDIEVPAIDLILFFSDAFIDDITIDCRVSAIGTAPVRCEGVLELGDESFVDLDRGSVGGEHLVSQDLAWRGQTFARRLDAVCGARLARTDTDWFDGVSRATLYRFAYSAPNTVSLPELARFNPFGIIFGDGLFDETMQVYGVRTNEGRWSAIQAVEVDSERMRLRYRTWERIGPNVQIKGEWRCERGFRGDLDPGTVTFTPSDILEPVTEPPDRPPDPCEGLTATVRDLVPRRAIREQALDKIARSGGRIGRWSVTTIAKGREVARFDAVTEGFGPEPGARWRIGDTVLDGSGQVQVDGETVNYEASGTRLILTTKAERPFEFFLRVEVWNKEGNTGEASRCVRYKPSCKETIRYVPTWTEYRDAHLEWFGIAEVPVGAAPDVTVERG
jgi:hypothetical protein